VSHYVGTVVTLTATRDASSSFTGWGGACGGTDPTCILPPLAGDASVTATFTRQTYTLTVTPPTNGTVSSVPAGISCPGGNCSATYGYDASVTLNAGPATGFAFAGWGGACAGAGTGPCTLRMTQARTVTASFARTFTDPTLTPGATPIKVLHITELRERIDALRIRYGLPAFPWTDPTLVARATPVKRIHLTDLRDALSQAYVKAGRPAPTYAEATISVGTTAIKASHLNELRQKVVELE
jgi:hypothetical protein